MTEDFCPHETKTAEAARTGYWPDELRAHLAACAVCEETGAVARRKEEEQRDRRTWIWSGALSGVAATVTAWASLEWIAPVVALEPEAFALGGGAVALTLGVLYFAVYRPFRNDSQ